LSAPGGSPLGAEMQKWGRKKKRKGGGVFCLGERARTAERRSARSNRIPVPSCDPMIRRPPSGGKPDPHCRGGAGRAVAKDKRRFYAMAGGRVTESAFIVNVLRLGELGSADDCREARSTAVRLVRMLEPRVRTTPLSSCEHLPKRVSFPAL
jgi:hypothetical protein